MMWRRQVEEPIDQIGPKKKLLTEQSGVMMYMNFLQLVENPVTLRRIHYDLSQNNFQLFVITISNKTKVYANACLKYQ